MTAPAPNVEPATRDVPRTSILGAGTRGYHELLYAAGATLFAFYFCGLHLRLPEWQPVDFSHLVAGTALTPMQYRVLLPFLVRQLQAAELPLLAGWGLGAYQRALDLLGCVAVLYSARYFWRSLGYRSGQAMAGSVLFALVLPFQFLLPTIRFHYCYDLPSIAFFTLCLGALVRRSWLVFYPVFILATFNRETTAFLVPIFLLVSLGRDRWPGVIGHAAAQTALWVTIKWFLWTQYGGNTDPAYASGFDLYKDSVAQNLRLLDADLSVWLSLASNWGFLWIPAFTQWRRIHHPFIARALWVVPLYVCAMFFVGELEELRIYGEMIPLVLAGAVLSRPLVA
jgi:hypothetical protein